MVKVPTGRIKTKYVRYLNHCVNMRLSTYSVESSVMQFKTYWGRLRMQLGGIQHLVWAGANESSLNLFRLHNDPISMTSVQSGLHNESGYLECWVILGCQQYILWPMSSEPPWCGRLAEQSAQSRPLAAVNASSVRHGCCDDISHGIFCRPGVISGQASRNVTWA